MQVSDTQFEYGGAMGMPELNSVAVRFEGPLEQTFQDEIQESAIRMNRWVLIVSGLLGGGFAALDLLMIPEQRYLIWFIRSALVLVVLLGLALSYTERFRYYSGHVAVAALLAHAAGTAGMLMFLPAQVGNAYFAGLMLDMMVLFGLLRQDFLKSVVCGLLILVSYDVSAAIGGVFAGKVLLMHNLFLGTALLLGAAQNYQRNTMARRLFWAGFSGEQPVAEQDVPAMDWLDALKAGVGRVDDEISVQKPVQESVSESEAEEVAVLEPQNTEPEAPGSVEEPVVESASAEVVASEPIVSSESEPVDVGSERDADRELKEAGTLFNLFMERISDVVWFADPDGRFLYVSPSCERLWGYGYRDLLKKSFKELLTKDSHEYFMAELRAVGRYGAGTLRPLELEVVCQNRVIKNGETLAIVFKEHPVYGNGIIGVTRDTTYRQKTEAELRRFNMELEGLIRQRSGELEETLRRLRQMEEALRNSEREESLENLPVIRYLRGGLENTLKQIGRLQSMTHQIQGIYDIKTMKKEDLEDYLKQVRALGNALDQSVRDSLNHLYGTGPAEAAPVAEEDIGFRFRLSDYLEKVLMGLGHRFKSTRHVVELDCPETLEVFGDPEDYSRIFRSLVEHSLDSGLRNTQEGIIEIRARIEGADLVVEYWDNGRGLTAETIQELFEKPYFNRLDTDLSLQVARELVRENLGGEFYLHNRSTGLVFEIRVPNMAEQIA